MARSGRGRSKCPPGVFCISSGLGTTLTIILVVALLFFLYAAFFLRPQAPTIIMPRAPREAPQTTVIPIKGGDSRYDMAPQPLRDWMAPPEFPPRGGIASIPINIPTQGLPESFQSIGNLSVGDGKVLPLYGRRTYGGSSDRWNYYSRTDTYNPVPVPLRNRGRDCMGDIGCPEVYSGDRMEVEGTGQHGTVRIFRIDGPKYVPGLI